MTRSTFSTMAAALLAAIALACPGMAGAADGRPLFPTGDPLDAYSQTRPAASGNVLVFETTEKLSMIGPPRYNSTTRVVLSSSTGGAVTWLHPGLFPAVIPGAQVDPCVLRVDATRVIVVWTQLDVAGAQSDLWIWEGDQAGTAAAGFPKLLISGQVSTSQSQPSLGVVRHSDDQHLFLAWRDDRAKGASVQLIHALDLSADADTDDTPDYRETDWDPVAGQATDTPLSLADFPQWSPSVGRSGVYWVDKRLDASEGAVASMWRCDLDPGPSGSSAAFYVPSVSALLREVGEPAATATGCAFEGPGIAAAPFEPYHQTVGGTAQAFAVLYDPAEIAAAYGATSARTRFAIVARHGGTDGDRDIFFYDTDTSQTVPVCSVASADPSDRNLLRQEQPSIALASAGAATVIWEDYRHNSDPVSETMSARLYRAAVANVPLAASRARLALGRTLTLTSAMGRSFSGAGVRFQRGSRRIDPAFLFVRYGGWKTLTTRSVSARGKALASWKPSRRGVFYLRAWFTGKKSGAWVANASKVVRVVVY